ncbi:MAG: asparaginase [Syntrophales bacterium LBB04]|nr:asparaginase [Syntrophales bacterium LBB04]
MPHILLIHTGGTMGMQAQENGELNSGQFINEIFHYVPEVRKIAEIDLITPFTLDSSDIRIEHWVELGHLLYQHMDNYDGFVIIHGTDTMSYTASALSYMLVNLPKPVIVTGSQRPLAAIRTDARSNLTHAIELATKPIPEVGLYFHDKLFRGNRTKKISIDNFDAFVSPNFPWLAQVGLHIERGISVRKPTGLFRLETRFDNRVLALRAFPSINALLWQGLLDTQVQVLLVEAFGSGNLPIADKSLLLFIEQFVQKDRLVVICSQSIAGTCDLSLYDGGRYAAQVGAISAGDMTFEASLVKAMFLLGLFEGDIDRVRKHFPMSIAGEISEDTKETLF